MGSDGHGADNDFDKIAQMAPLGPPLGHHLLQRLLLDVWRLIPGHPEAHFGRPEVHFWGPEDQNVDFVRGGMDSIQET